MATNEPILNLQAADGERQQPPPTVDKLEGDADASLAAQTLFAVVNANGSLARGHGAVSSRAFGGGNYEVIFNQNVAGGAFTASIGLSGPDGISPPGQISVVRRVGTANGVFIETTNSAGTRTDLGFHLAVHL